MQLPALSLDLSSSILGIVGFIFVFLFNRFVKSNDKNFDIVNKNIESVKADTLMGNEILHKRIDSMKSEVQSDIKDVRIDTAKTHEKLEAYRDKAADGITAVRISLEDKMEVHDERIRKLEQKP